MRLSLLSLAVMCARYRLLANSNFYKYLIYVGAFLWLFNPGRHAKTYYYVQDEDIPAEMLVQSNNGKVNLNITIINNLIAKNRLLRTSEVFALRHFEIPTVGGEFLCKTCFSDLKTAVIVPYRERTEQLKIFLNYMHYFLQQQDVSYRIFIVEQRNMKPFNRAKLLNYGALEAIKLQFSCLILHDVDLLPISTGNIYSCSRLPRHMSCSLDTFRYTLPYPELFGGAVAIQAAQYKDINGMSNQFDGWGAEDDDLHKRLLKYNYAPYRFSPALSRYTMLVHSKAPPNKNRYEQLKNSLDRQDMDGLNSLGDYTISLEPLFTHIKVH